MSTSQGDVLLAVKRVLASESSNAVQDTISHGGISRLGVNDNVDESIFGITLVADDEGAAVQALAQTGALLIKVGVSGKVDFDDGASDIGLADTKQILFASIVDVGLVGELGSDIVVEATLVVLVAGAGVGDGSENEEGEDGEQREDRPGAKARRGRSLRKNSHDERFNYCLQDTLRNYSRE